MPTMQVFLMNFGREMDKLAQFHCKNRRDKFEVSLQPSKHVRLFVCLYGPLLCPRGNSNTRACPIIRILSAFLGLLARATLYINQLVPEAGLLVHHYIITRWSSDFNVNSAGGVCFQHNQPYFQRLGSKLTMIFFITLENLFPKTKSTKLKVVWL